MAGKFGESVTNPKRTIERREKEAEGSASTKDAPAKKGDMSQAQFSGYGKKDKAKDAAGLAKALKKRG